MDGHSSGTPVAERLARPTRAAARKHRCRLPGVPPLFGLAPGGVCRAAPVAGRAVGSYPTVSPLPARRSRAGGLFSVALSLGSPPPGVTRHRVSVEPGLSSPRGCPRSAAIQPSDPRALARLRAPPGQAGRPAGRGSRHRPCRRPWPAGSGAGRTHDVGRGGTSTGAADSRSAAGPPGCRRPAVAAPARGHRPMPARRQRRPREAQAGIDLALGRDVGMADDVARLDGGMARRGCRGRVRSARRSARRDNRDDRRAGSRSRCRSRCRSAPRGRASTNGRRARRRDLRAPADRPCRPPPGRSVR